jgi:hypothetical protein
MLGLLLPHLGNKPVNYFKNWGIIDIEFVWTTALLRDSLVEPLCKRIAQQRILMGCPVFLGNRG